MELSKKEIKHDITIDDQEKTRLKNLRNFLNNAVLTYRSKYNYDNILYVNDKTKIDIKCNNCGDEFKTSPYMHLNRIQCKPCYGGGPMNTDSFTKFANLEHKNFYIYNRVDYVNSHTNVEIGCPEHKTYFWQRPDKHLRGAGCPTCGWEKRALAAKGYRNTKEIFLMKAFKKHGSRCDYSLINYIDNDTIITIRCLKHGNFDQLPKNHLISAWGCPRCNVARLKTREEFEKESNIIHENKYKYDQVVYKGNKIKVIIFCIKCKDTFEQVPNSHLRGFGCYRCAHANYSKIALEWLDDIEKIANSNNNNTRKIVIQKADSPGGEDMCKLAKYGIKSEIYKSHIKLDGVDGYNGIAYEFWGCYFHGCPKCFPNRDTITYKERTHRINYVRTIEKIRIIKELGFELVQMWECDYKKSKTLNQC